MNSRGLHRLLYLKFHHFLPLKYCWCFLFLPITDLRKPCNRKLYCLYVKNKKKKQKRHIIIKQQHSMITLYLYSVMLCGCYSWFELKTIHRMWFHCQVQFYSNRTYKLERLNLTLSSTSWNEAVVFDHPTHSRSLLCFSSSSFFFLS